MGIEPTNPAVHEVRPALKTGRHTSTDPLPHEWPTLQQPPGASATGRDELHARERAAQRPRISRPGSPAASVSGRPPDQRRTTVRGPRGVARRPWIPTEKATPSRS